MEELIFENIGWNTRLTTNPDFVLREIGDECILVPVVSSGPFENTMMTMNETAAYLWKQFSKGRTPAEVKQVAKLEFDDGTVEQKIIEKGIYRYVLESASLKILIPMEESE